MARHGLPTESSSSSIAGHAKDVEMKGSLTTVLVLCLHTWNKNPAERSYEVMKD